MKSGARRQNREKWLKWEQYDIRVIKLLGYALDSSKHCLNGPA